MYTRISLIKKKTGNSAVTHQHVFLFCTLPEKIRNIRIIAQDIIKPVILYHLVQ